MNGTLTLYDIDNSILECIDEETGEVIDEARLDALMMERSEKIENVALWIKNLKADVKILREEKEVFAKRQAQAQKKLDSLEQYLLHALDGKKFSSSLCTVSWRRSERIEVDDESELPKEYMRTTVSEAPDKVAIKEAIKSGTVIPGARVIESMNAVVR